MAKKLSKEDKERRSIAMKAAWARKRERGGKNIKRAYNRKTPINTIPVDPNPDRPSLAEWRQETPTQQIERYQEQLKMYEDRNRRLEQKLIQVQTLSNALQSIISSIQNLDRMTP